MTQILEHATVITMNAGGDVMPDGAIAIDGGQIVATGRTEEVRAAYPGAEATDLRGHAIMPGFANCHTHLTLTLSRGIQEDYSFPSTLRLPRPVADYLTDDERTALAQVGVIEAIRSGTTALFEIGRSLATYAGALADSGVRVLLGETAADLDQARAAQDGVFEFDRARGEATLDRIRSLHAEFHGAGDGRVRVAAAAHAPEAVSPWLLKEVRALSEQFGTPSTIHLNQSWWEVEAVRNERGVLPTEYLDLHDFLWPDLIAGHCRCMDTREISLLGRSGATVSFNSAIAARRGYSPRVADLAAAGCPIAMGSDNMAEDMIEVARTGLFMERVRTGDGERPTPEETLEWATANGHEALGFEQTGRLIAGNRADLVVIDMRRAHLVPSTRIASGFLHQGTPADVRSVMVDGRWVLRDGELLTMNEAEVIDQADRAGRRAWGALLEEFPELDLPFALDVREQP
jgi:5-methylthioadenosine/S-adenosylhomocysteine deaminase